MNAVGLTVGHQSPYVHLARVAARCFETNTGLDVATIGESDARRLGPIHPAAWRLWAFDLVEAENIVYFDADWFCLKQWNPLELLPSRHVIACQDFVSTSDWPGQSVDDDVLAQRDLSHAPPDAMATLRADYVGEVSRFAGITMAPTTWINSGLMILNRANHETWLRLAQQIYLTDVGHHPIYYEQPSLVRAAQDLPVSFRYLPRCFNVLAAGRRDWPQSVVGLHVKVKHYPHFAKQIAAGAILSHEDVCAYFE